MPCPFAHRTQNHRPTASVSERSLHGHSQTSRSRTSNCRKGAPTIVDSIGDLVKGAAIALLCGGMGGGEGGHCRRESSKGSGEDLGWLRGRCGCVEMSGEEDGFLNEWHWRLRMKSQADLG